MRNVLILIIASATLLSGCGDSNQNDFVVNNTQTQIAPKQVSFRFSLLPRDSTDQVPAEVTNFHFVARDDNFQVLFDENRPKSSQVDLELDGRATSIELSFAVGGITTHQNLFPLVGTGPLEIMNPPLQPVPLFGAESLTLTPTLPTVATNQTIAFEATLGGGGGQFDVTGFSVFEALNDAVFSFTTPSQNNLGTAISEGQTDVNVTYTYPIGDLLIGTDQGLPQVKVFDPARTEEGFLRTFFAFNPGFSGGVRVAAGDINGDGVDDIVTGTANGSSRVKVVDGVENETVADFFAYDTAFTGGVRVAVGDINGDGRDDIITGAGPGGAPRIRVFSGVDQSPLGDFFAYSSTFQGGVFVASGDVNDDGFADIITGSGPGGPPTVKVFDGQTLAETNSFLAFDANFTGGVRVASGDLNGDGFSDIITGAGPGGGPRVRVFDGQTGNPGADFFAFSPSFQGGVTLASTDFGREGNDDIIVGPGPGGSPEVRVFDRNGQSLTQFLPFFAGFTGGVFVGGLSSPPPSGQVTTSTQVTVLR